MMPTIELGEKVPSTTLAPCQNQSFADVTLPGNLSGHAISSGFVTASAQAAKFGLTLIGAVILGRLLTPQDFGLIGMVSTITAFLSLFSDAGLSTTTIQAEGLTEQQASNLFWTNVSFSGLMGVVAAFLAPAVAWFYHDARLTAVTLVLAFTFPLTGVALQHRALLNRQMKFGSLATIEIGSMLFSLIVGCLMALLHFGYWSLAGMQLGAAAGGCFLTWLNSKWRPGMPRRDSQTWSLMSFGLDLTASSVVHRLARGCDTLLLGRVWGPTPVGLYSRASSLLFRPMDQFLSPVSSVLIPILCRLRNEPQRYRQTFLQSYDVIGLVTFPLSALFLAVSRPLIRVILGPNWDGAASLFAGLTVAALYLPLAVSAMWLFTSQGRSRDMLIANVVLSSLTLLSFFFGVPYGALGMVLCYSVSGLLIRLPVLYYLAGRQGPVHAFDLFKVLFRHLPVWLSVYVFTSLTHLAVQKAGPLLQLAICIPTGLTVGIATIGMLEYQLQTAKYLLKVVRSTAMQRFAARTHQENLTLPHLNDGWLEHKKPVGIYLRSIWSVMRSLYRHHSTERFVNASIFHAQIALGRWSAIKLPPTVIHTRFYVCKDECVNGRQVIKLPHGRNEFSCRLIRTLKDPVELARYKRIIATIQTDPHLKEHCAAITDVRRNGGYRSEYIEGINLAELRAELLRSDSLPVETLRPLKAAAINLLQDLANYHRAKGELIGDWPLHNLLYSPAKKSIINVDVEGFFTYAKGSTEAHYSFIEANLLNLIELVNLKESDQPGERAMLDIFRAIDEVRHGGSQYSGLNFVAGYHTIELQGKRFRGQRDCAQRLAAVPFDFKNKTVLDLGCNVGGMLHCLSNTIRKGYGFDFNPNCVNAAQLIRSFNRTTNLEFFTIDLDRQPFALIQSLVLHQKADICFLLSMCRWLTNWKLLIGEASNLAETLLFESNGSEKQQAEQASVLREHYRRVDLLCESSNDDFSLADRKLFLCSNQS